MQDTLYSPYPEKMKEQAMKRAFALAFRSLGSAVEAAKSIEPNWQHSYWIVENWTQDAEVLELMRDKARDIVLNETLPTKEELALEIIKEARDARATRSDRLSYYTLAAKMLSYIDKPAEPSSNTTTISTKVFVLPARAANIDDFELRSGAHQAKLINAN